MDVEINEGLPDFALKLQVIDLLILPISQKHPVMNLENVNIPQCESTNEQSAKPATCLIPRINLDYSPSGGGRQI